METKKKSIKRIIAIVCAVLFNIAGLFYITDPLEEFHHYEIPANPGDVVLCFFQDDHRQQEFYVITNDGKIRRAEYKEWIKQDYEKINQNETTCVKIKPLTDRQLKRLTKINANNQRIVKLPNPFVDLNMGPTRKLYYIVQKENGEFRIKLIWGIEYWGRIGGKKFSEDKCRSKYTDSIGRYIDYAVDEARKAGV